MNLRMKVTLILKTTLKVRMTSQTETLCVTEWHFGILDFGRCEDSSYSCVRFWFGVCCAIAVNVMSPLQFLM